mgnify:FL=1
MIKKGGSTDTTIALSGASMNTASSVAEGKLGFC